ncbi:MAG: hypothetical protein APF80_09930 [Alphaproteobacteria bacterium BRH_c36]|nr:MAG: hypothetical protein APF80_09930 [Alphaproteobacteria bacterium BRH_c36]
MKLIVVLLTAASSLALTTAIVAAEDFSKDSKANTFGLSGEQKAMFSGKVVDILCELSGDCPVNCGDGNRNLGIVRAPDNALVVVSKNAQFEFNGAVDDLLPYCNKSVDVDGLLIGEDPGVKAKVYMVQFIRLSGETDWNKAELWTKAWKKRNTDAAGEGPWYRRDPRVAKQIEKEGYLGNV